MADKFVLTTQLAVQQNVLGLDKAIRNIRNSLKKVDAPVGVKVVASSVTKLQKDLARRLKAFSVPVNVKVSPNSNRNLRALTKSMIELQAAKGSLTSSSINVKVGGASVSRLNKLSAAFADIAKNGKDATIAIRRFNAAVAAGVSPAAAMASSMKTVSSTSRAVGKSLKSTADFAEHFADITALATRRFLAYQIGARAILGITAKIGQSFREAFDFQGDLVTLGQVTGQTKTSLNSLGDSIRNLGIQLGVASSELAGVVKTLSQAEFAGRELEAGLQAIAKAKLGPSFGDIERIADGLIAARAQFGLTASEFEGALGSINAVSKAFAVESDDLITVIQKAGGAFATAGGTLNELLATFTSIRATTRESADSIATALRTIVPRFQRQTTISALREIGVELVNAEGKFIGIFEAANKLNAALANLPAGDIRFAQTAEILGGVRQFSKIIPLITEAEKRQRALNIANAGGNSLNEDAARAQEKISVQLTKINEQFNKLIGDVVQSDTFKVLFDGFIEGSKAVLRFADALKELIPLATAFAAIQGARFAFHAVRRFPSAFTKFASGGKVPGQGDEDTVNALLTPGEFVIRKSAAKALGLRRLEALNNLRTGDLPKFAKGGPVGFTDGGNVDPPTVSQLTKAIELMSDNMEQAAGTMKLLLKEFDKERQAKNRENRNITGGLRLPESVTTRAKPSAQELAIFVAQKPDLIDATKSKTRQIEDIKRASEIRNIDRQADAELLRRNPSAIEASIDAAAEAELARRAGPNVGNIPPSPSPFVPLSDLRSSARRQASIQSFSRLQTDRAADNEILRRGSPISLDEFERFEGTRLNNNPIAQSRRSQAFALDSDGRIAERERRLRERRQKNAQINATIKQRINSGQSPFIAKLSTFSKLGSLKNDRLSDALASSFVGGSTLSSSLSSRPDIEGLGLEELTGGISDTRTIDNRNLPTRFRRGAKGGRNRLRTRFRAFGRSVSGRFPAASAGLGKLGGATGGLAGAAFLGSLGAEPGGGTQGALQGAGIGATFGAALGPVGAAVGALAGGIIGYTSAIKQQAKELEDTKFDEQVASLVETINKASAGKLGPGAVGQISSQFGVFDERRRSLTTTQDDRVALSQSVSQAVGGVETFVESLRSGSKSFADFTSRGGLQLLGIISKETGQSLQSLKDATEQTIDLQQKAAATEALIVQADRQRLVEFQQQEGLIGALQDAADAADVMTDRFLNAAALVGGNLSVSNFKGQPGIGGLSRISQISNVGQLQQGVNQITGLLGPQFAKLGGEAVGSATLSRELPLILKEFGQARNRGQDFDLFGSLKGKFANRLPDSIISSITAAIGGMDEQDLLRELDDVSALSEKVINDAGLGRSAEILAQAADIFTDQLNKFTDNINQVLAQEIQVRQNRLDRLDKAFGLQEDLNRQAGFAPTLQDIGNRQGFQASEALGRFGGAADPSAILNRISGVRTRIQNLTAGRETATSADAIKDFTVGIADSLSELDALNKAFSILTDRTAQISRLQEDLSLSQSNRAGKRDALTDFAFSDAAGRADLSRQAVATRLALDGGLGAVPGQNRPDVGSFLSKFANIELESFGLSNRLDANGNQRFKTGAEAAADLAADDIERTAGALGIDPQKVRDVFVDGFAPVEVKIAQAITEALNEQNGFADALDTVNTNFLGSFGDHLNNFDTNINTFLSEFVANMQALEQSRLKSEKITAETKLDNLSPKLDAAERARNFGTGDFVADKRVLDLANRARLAKAQTVVGPSSTELIGAFGDKDSLNPFTSAAPTAKNAKAASLKLIDQLADQNNFSQNQKNSLIDRTFSRIDSNTNTLGLVPDTANLFKQAFNEQFGGDPSAASGIQQDLAKEGPQGKALFNKLVGANASDLEGFGSDLSLLGDTTLPTLNQQFNSLNKTIQGLNGLLTNPVRAPQTPSAPLAVPQGGAGPQVNVQPVAQNQEAATRLTQSLAGFGGSSNVLSQAMNNFPRTLEISATHRVEVAILGGDVLARIEPTIRALMEESVNTALAKYTKDKFPGSQAFA
jgi:TP901 family phage tail tape measure protein